jgi:hypothetical protein
MYVCMYIYIRVYVYIYIYISIFTTYLHIHVCVCMYVCMHACIHYISVYIYICVCVYVCIYVCMYVCMYRYICIYIYIHIDIHYVSSCLFPPPRVLFPPPRVPPFQIAESHIRGQRSSASRNVAFCMPGRIRRLVQEVHARESLAQRSSRRKGACRWHECACFSRDKLSVGMSRRASG